MRELFKIIKENIILLLGTGLFTYNLLNFKYYHYSSIKFKQFSTPASDHCYYDSTGLILLTIGAIFIVVGLLKLRTKKDKK